jgi:hypothetical protein
MTMAVEEATDVFGKSVNDFDPWADGQEGSDDVASGDSFSGGGFGDFADFEAMEGCTDEDDDAFFKAASCSTNDDLTADTAQSSKSDEDEGGGGGGGRRKTPPSPKRSFRKKPPSRRGNLSISSKDTAASDESKDEGSCSARRRAPMRRHSSRRSLSMDDDIFKAAAKVAKSQKEPGEDDGPKLPKIRRRASKADFLAEGAPNDSSLRRKGSKVDPTEMSSPKDNSLRRRVSKSDGKEESGSKDSSRSRSRSADTEVPVDEDDVGETDKKENSCSRRDSLREQRKSFRVSKSNDKDKPSGRTAHPRRQSSSRKLVVPTSDVSSSRQQSVRHLFQNGELAGETESLESPVGECIVSKSRFQKPTRSRSGLSRGLSAAQMKTPNGESRRAVSRSSSMSHKADSPASGGLPIRETRRGPPQRAKSAIVQCPNSIRGSLASAILKEQPEEDETETSSKSPSLPPSGLRKGPPTKSNSTGAISIRERRQRQKAQSEGQNIAEPSPSSARRSLRRLGSKDGDLPGGEWKIEL